MKGQVTRSVIPSLRLRLAGARGRSRIGAPAPRRSYASAPHGNTAHGKAQHEAAKSSDMPWLIGAVAVTVPGLAWILSGDKSGSSAGHHHSGGGEHKEEEAPAGADEEKAAAGTEEEKHEGEGEGEGASTQGGQGGGDGGEKKSGGEEGSSGSGAGSAAAEKAKPGQKVPPPPADSSSTAGGWEEKKEKHEEVYKPAMKNKDTSVASSSSDFPSKKTSGEHPKEDPKRGEGEANRKGGPDS